ncbi:MAG TPA: hypothetical protein ENG40_04235 [Thermoprotei archaeon]|nr:hypothetical protein [Thermoprotei archaeon]
MDTINIDFDSLEISKYNVRIRINKDRVRALALNILQYGLLNPLTVIEGGTLEGVKGKYYILCGRYRYLALQYIRENYREEFEKRFTKIPVVVVYPREPVDAMLISLSENLQQNTMSEEEVAEVISKLTKEHKLPLNKIERRIGLDLKNIEPILKLYNFVKSTGAYISRPGRPFKEERNQRVSTMTVLRAEELADYMEYRGFLKSSDRDRFIKDFLNKTKGLSTKQVYEIVRKAKTSSQKLTPRVLDRIIYEVKSIERINRNIHIKKELVKKITILAKKNGKTFDEMLEEILENALKSYKL